MINMLADLFNLFFDGIDYLVMLLLSVIPAFSFDAASVFNDLLDIPVFGDAINLLNCFVDLSAVLGILLTTITVWFVGSFIMRRVRKQTNDSSL